MALGELSESLLSESFRRACFWRAWFQRGFGERAFGGDSGNAWKYSQNYPFLRNCEKLRFCRQNLQICALRKDWQFLLHCLKASQPLPPCLAFLILMILLVALYSNIETIPLLNMWHGQFWSIYIRQQTIKLYRTGMLNLWTFPSDFQWWVFAFVWKQSNTKCFQVWKNSRSKFRGYTGCK